MLRSTAIQAICLLLLGASLAFTPATANAQGLREAVVEVLDRAQVDAGDICAIYETAITLRAEIEGGSAAAFMEYELIQLEELIERAAPQCSQADANPQVGLEGDELSVLIATCEEYGEARAFCLFRTECEAVREANGRLEAFWAMALEFCPD